MKFEFSLFPHALCRLKMSSQLIRIGFVTRDAILCVLIEKHELPGQKIPILREIKNSCKRARRVRHGLLYLPMKFQAESFKINGAMEAETG